MKIQFLSPRYMFVALTLATCVAVAVAGDLDSAAGPSAENIPSTDSEMASLDCTAVMSPSMDAHGRSAGGMCTECMCNNGKRMPMFLCEKGQYPKECKYESRRLEPLEQEITTQHGHLDKHGI